MRVDVIDAILRWQGATGGSGSRSPLSADDFAVAAGMRRPTGSAATVSANTATLTVVKVH